MRECLVSEDHISANRVTHLDTALKLVIFRQVTLLTVSVDFFRVELDVQRLFVRELSCDFGTFSLRVAEDFKAIAEQSCFKGLVLLVGHVEDTGEHFLLDVHQDREQDEDLGEVEHESGSKSIAFELSNAEMIALEEALVACKLLFWEHFDPELQLHHEVKDYQTLGVE